MIQKMYEVYLGSALAPGEQDSTQASNYKGNWDASTNTPTLVNGTGTPGDFYICTVAGTCDFGAGSITFEVNDWVVYTGEAWVVNKAVGEIINDNTIDTQLTWSSHKIDAEIKGLLDDNFTTTDTTWSSQKIQQAINTGTPEDVYIYKGEVEELPESAVLGNAYKCDNVLYWWNGTEFEPFESIRGISVNGTVQTITNGNVDITVPTKTSDLSNDSGFIDKTVDDLENYYTKSDTDTLLAGKVDKVAGKGLSTEDFTTAEKTKLAGIEAGAQVNTIESISVNGVAKTPDANKNIDLPDYYSKSEVNSLLKDKVPVYKNISNSPNNVGQDIYVDVTNSMEVALIILREVKSNADTTRKLTPYIGHITAYTTDSSGYPDVRVATYIASTCWGASGNAYVRMRIMADDGNEYEANLDQTGTTYNIRLLEFSESVIKSITGQENIFTKNYSFKTYGIQFFGDSIPYGVGVDDDSTDMSLYHRWPTVFCSKVEATEINQAVSGSLFSVEKSGVPTIKSKLQASLSGSYPYLFINGGINDWQWGIPLDDFANAVDDTFNYIKTNYSGHVVIISPFNVLKNLVGSPLYPLNEYRKILAQKAYKYGFDYINGGNISLAKGSAVGAKRYQFSDGLHPSGFGHYLIAHELIQQFFNLTWDTYDAMIDHDEIIFSGKYLAGINAPIWKVLYASLTLPASPSTITLQRIDTRLSNNKVIIQSLNGCIMYTGFDNNSWSCPLPLYNFNSGVGTMQGFNFYSGNNGLDCQYQSEVAIINGNLFVEFIRWFDLNNTHNF